jgi:hypothetical protein
MKLGRCYNIAFSSDENKIVTISRDVFLWDLITKKKIKSKHVLSNPCQILIDRSSEYIYIKNTSGIISRINFDLSMMNTFNQIKIEGPNMIQNRENNTIINSDWNGNIYFLDKENLEISNPCNLGNTMITHLQDLGNKFGFAFLVTPKWVDDNKSMEKPYIIISDWKMENMQKVQFNYNEIKYFSIDMESMKILVRVRKDDRDFYIELLNLSNTSILFSKKLDVEYSGNACEINSKYNNFCYLDKDKIVIHELTSLRIIKEVMLNYPSSLTLSPSGKYLGIGGWENSKIIDNANYSEI